MGVCTTREESQMPPEDTREWIPKPIVFKSNKFLFLHYTERKITYDTIEDVKMNINEFMLEEFTSIFYKNAEGTNDLLVFLVGSYGGTYGARGGMIVEMVGSTLMIQIGNAKKIQLLFNEYQRGNTKRNLNFSQPTVTFLRLIEALYIEASANSDNVSSAAKMERFLRGVLHN